MATTTVTAGREVSATSGTQTSWDDARNNPSASSFTEYSTPTVKVDAIEEVYVSGRGGGSYIVSRTFLSFDVSGVGGTITAADLYVYGKTNDSCSVRPVKSTAFGGDGNSAFVATDFDNWNPSSPTVYGGESTWSTGAYVVMSLNGTAISDMNTNGYLIVALVGNTYDYPDVTPLVDITRRSGISFKSTTGEEIYLDITYTPTGYGNDVNGVSAANIVNVIGVATADIDTVIGVS